MNKETKHQFAAILATAQNNVPAHKSRSTQSPDRGINELPPIIPTITCTTINPYRGLTFIRQPHTHNPIINSSTMYSPGFSIETYSDWSVVLRGDTKPIKDKLMALGGRYNFRLQGGPGWIFSKKKETELRRLIF